ncbi:hypothetical protein N665_0189s0036 [Sinapis alba]|nr:hypothetical protein N665_0189s0036 [Sinapis alba]
MSKAKDFKEVFKKMDQYNDGEISWEELDFHGIRNRSPPMTMSQVDNMFGELETDGEDRVFGASKSLVNQLHHSSLPIKPKDENVINVELKKDVSNSQKIENQVETPKKPVVDEKSFKELEDWVVVEKNNINA